MRFVMGWITVLILLAFVSAQTIETNDRLVQFNKDGTADNLDIFLSRYKSDLKISIIPIYDALNLLGMDEKDIMEFTETDLRQALKDKGLESVHIGRFVNLLRKYPGSQVYKEWNIRTLVVLSDQEQRALDNVINAAYKVNQQIQEIENMINQLNINYNQSETIIHEKADEIIRIVNIYRNTSLTKLRNRKHAKHNKLDSELNIWKNFKNDLEIFHYKAQEIIQGRCTSSGAPWPVKHIVGNSSLLLQNKIMAVIPERNVMLEVGGYVEDMIHAVCYLFTKNKSASAIITGGFENLLHDVLGAFAW